MEYSKCLVQVDEILNYLNPEELKKIPENVRKTIKDNKDKNYEWKYDEGKKLEEQNLNRKSIAILSYLNMEYLLNDEQRKLMGQIHRVNEQKQEEEKRKQYNPENIFENKSNIKEDKTVQVASNESTSKESKESKNLAMTKKDRWYNKIKLYIKSLFSKKSVNNF